jgi:hypothetical protein
MADTVKAVIDRFEGPYAILLVGDDQYKLEVLKKSLPKGIKEGTWLKLEIEGTQVLGAIIDAEETEKARQRIAEKLAALRRGDHLKE